MKAIFFFALLHFVVMITVFFVFGLGLEGPAVGGIILGVLLQPMLFLAGDLPVGVAPQSLFLLPLNSFIWGAVIVTVLKGLVLLRKSK